ncbi:MAG: hypothetical protein SFT92_10140 [Rickettsiales bacterium]|nr:hypothetical protein [Rickettsiales bacterium]
MADYGYKEIWEIIGTDLGIATDMKTRQGRSPEGALIGIVSALKKAYGETLPDNFADLRSKSTYMGTYYSNADMLRAFCKQLKAAMDDAIGRQLITFDECSAAAFPQIETRWQR